MDCGYINLLFAKKWIISSRFELPSYTMQTPHNPLWCEKCQHLSQRSFGSRGNQKHHCKWNRQINQLWIIKRNHRRKSTFYSGCWWRCSAFLWRRYNSISWPSVCLPPGRYLIQDQDSLKIWFTSCKSWFLIIQTIMNPNLQTHFMCKLGHMLYLT